MIPISSIAVMMLVTFFLLWGYWPTRYPQWFNFALMSVFTLAFSCMAGILATLVRVGDLSSLDEGAIVEILQLPETVFVALVISTLMSGVWATWIIRKPA